MKTALSYSTGFFSLTLYIFKKFLGYTLPIIIFVIILILTKIIFNYRRFGGSLFSIFKQKTRGNYHDDLIMSTIDNVKGIRKTIHLKNLFSNYLIIDEKGLFLLYYYNDNGILRGNINNEYLEIKTLETINKVKNPFFLIKEDLTKIKQKIITKKIVPLIITNTDCIMAVEGYTDIDFVKIDRLYEMLSLQIGKINKKQIDISETYQLFKSANYIK